MYARFGKLTAGAGKRNALTQILLRASALTLSLPGCQAYVVLEDLADENTVSVFEVWDDKESHANSLRNESVRALIAEAMPIIAGTAGGSEMRVVSNFGVDTNRQ
jgi:quinol monooxygenase YgiN